jgi:hypothetical protein
MAYDPRSKSNKSLVNSGADDYSSDYWLIAKESAVKDIVLLNQDKLASHIKAAFEKGFLCAMNLMSSGLSIQNLANDDYVTIVRGIVSQFTEINGQVVHKNDVPTGEADVLVSELRAIAARTGCPVNELLDRSKTSKRPFSEDLERALAIQVKLKSLMKTAD